MADDSGFYVAMRRNDMQPQRYVACFDPDTGQPAVAAIRLRGGDARSESIP